MTFSDIPIGHLCGRGNELFVVLEPMQFSPTAPCVYAARLVSPNGAQVGKVVQFALSDRVDFLVTHTHVDTVSVKPQVVK